MLNKGLSLLILLLVSTTTFSAETCSRTAFINFQEVLIDTDSTRKGEGLRFYLERDEEALQYLNRYQRGTRLNWRSAAMGTAGTALILSGLFVNSASENRSLLYIGGATLLTLNFLISKTLETTNEQNLIKAIEEYNKRNLPRIELFEPRANSNEKMSFPLGFMLSKKWDF